ncbi:hypothetical protein MPSEU_000535000 [Mayamaea pseudoterrestris]|nr:hypothetical protein MPSEU_000535000 [Mayamaea pseudoterrestris]
MSTDNDESTLYTDLKGFLASDRLDLRRAATDAVLQIADENGRHQIVAHGLVPLLSCNLSSTDYNVSINSLKVLLQLTSAEHTPLAKATALQCVEELLQAGGGLDRLMEILLTTASTQNDDWRNRVNLAMSLLANVTRSEEGAIALCGRQLPEEAVVASAKSSNDDDTPFHIPPRPTLELLLARFLNPQYIQQEIDYDQLLIQSEDPLVLDTHSGDPFQHFAAVLMNATQVEQGRRFLLQLHYAPDSRKADGPPPTSNFQRLLPQLRHANPIRRRGVAGLIRNCCSDKDSAFWFTTQVRLVDEHLLYPLAGPEDLDEDEKQNLNPDLWLTGPSKQRETDYLTRLFLVQALLMLCKAGRQARKEMNRVKTSVILKWAGMVEEHEDVSEVIEQCMEYLARDQAFENGDGEDIVNRIEILEDDGDDDINRDNESGAAAARCGTSVGEAMPVSQEDFDNVD